MSAVMLIGRICFATVFVIVPLQVIRSSAMVAAAPPLRRIPLPRIAVIAVSAVAIAGAVAVILGVWPDLGALMIAAYLVPVTSVMHPYWTFADPAQVKQHRESLLLNVSILGGSLILFWALNQSQHVPAALVSTPLFGRW
jgi:uncharacterized membrane protein YphA (DoxX/SURF4 family)